MTRKIFSVAAGFGFAALFMWLLVRGLNWREVGAVLSTAQVGLLLAALVLLVADYGFRVFRWRMLLAYTGNVVAYRQAMAALVAGFAANNILPFRAGDILRVVMLRRTAGMPLTPGIGTLLVERIWDLATLGVLFVVGVQAGNSRSISEFAPAALVLIGLGVATLVSLPFFASPLAERLTNIKVRHSFLESGPRLTGKLCRALADVSRPTHVIWLGSLSLLIWGTEGLVLYCCGQALHISLSLYATYFILAAANLSGLLPGTPGNVGTFHYFAALAAASFGVDMNRAAALAIVFHALMWLPITFSGLIFFATSSIGIGRVVSLVSSSAASDA